jgi:hypothetical protein
MFSNMTYKTRKRLALLVLVVGLPLYIIVASTVVGLLERPTDAPHWQFVLIELLIYTVLGILWALPFRKLFRGIGKPDPDQPQG